MKYFFLFLLVCSIHFQANSADSTKKHNLIADSVIASTDSSSETDTAIYAVPTTTAGGGEGASVHQTLKQKFIDGGPLYMTPILLCLILGLSIIVERIIYLNLSTINTRKFTQKVETALNEGGVEAAKEICRNTRGPIASIYYQGLMRYNEGLDKVEKSIIAYGSVQTGLLESGLTWIGLFVTLAPMLGFLGTAIGMLEIFESVEAAGDVSPTILAGGIKIKLITTVSGLAVAITLQIFYNYLITKIDSIVNSMEDASITLIDMLYNHNRPK